MKTNTKAETIDTVERERERERESFNIKKKKANNKKKMSYQKVGRLFGMHDTS